MRPLSGYVGGDVMEVEFPDIFSSKAQILVATTTTTVTENLTSATSMGAGNESVVTVSTCVTTTSDTTNQIVPGGADFLERLASVESVTRQDEVQGELWDERGEVAVGMPIVGAIEAAAANVASSPHEEQETPPKRASEPLNAELHHSGEAKAVEVGQARRREDRLVLRRRWSAWTIGLLRQHWARGTGGLVGRGQNQGRRVRV